MKIALVQLCSFGDCLYATLVARQIKRDYPDSHLTWVVGDKYASILEGNPMIDAIQKIKISGVGDALSGGWQQACVWVHLGLECGNLDKAYYTQIIPKNIEFYDGLIRSTTYRGYGNKIHGPHNPEVYLRSAEVDRVAAFAAEHQLDQYRNVLLFECNPGSGQAKMTPDRAQSIAHRLASIHNDTAFVLSSGTALSRTSAQVIDASLLTYRENAALSRHCTGLIGCSSGITWLTTSTAGQLLPMLQILTLNPGVFGFASVQRDFEQFQMDPTLVIEMADPEDSRIVACIDQWIRDGHKTARRNFNEHLKLKRSDVVAQDIFYIRDWAGFLLGALALGD